MHTGMPLDNEIICQICAKTAIRRTDVTVDAEKQLMSITVRLMIQILCLKKNSVDYMI